MVLIWFVISAGFKTNSLNPKVYHLNMIYLEHGFIAVKSIFRHSINVYWNKFKYRCGGHDLRPAGIWPVHQDLYTKYIRF